MPVEIRELIIKTNIVSNSAREEKSLANEQILLLKQKMVQECFDALKDKVPKSSFDR